MKILIIVMFIFMSVSVFAQSNFNPEILELKLSSHEVAPGDKVEATWVWKNIGDLPSVNNMAISVHIRKNDVGFYNYDGGGWFGSKGLDQPTMANYYPKYPTSKWYCGKVVTEKNDIYIPAHAPEGRYHILVCFFDRGGNVLLSDKTKYLLSPIEKYTKVDLGDIIVTKSPKKEEKIFKYDITPNIKEVEPTKIKEEKNIYFGNRDFGIYLDENNNYAISKVKCGKDTYESSLKFPTVVLYDKNLKRLELLASDTRWNTKISKLDNKINIDYSISGFEMLVSYTILKDMITVSVSPIKEDKYKALCLSGGSELLYLNKEKINPYILNSSGGGSIFKIGKKEVTNLTYSTHGWTYPASFISMGQNNSAVTVRCPNFGGQWYYGLDFVNDKYSLVSDVSLAFRPGNQSFYTPLTDPTISLQFVKVKDTNKDKNINWVDVGIDYRTRFIKKNQNLDKSDLESLQGKIDVGYADWSSAQNYFKLFEEMKSYYFAPQKWWFVGAHTPKENGYVDPPYTEKPDPCHNGENNFDYFAIKKEAKKLGIKLGIHELYQDMSVLNDDFENTSLKLDETLSPKGTWGFNINDKSYAIYAKSFKNPKDREKFFEKLDAHLKNWDVKAGDTWHWDCLSAMGGQRDYSPEHPSTNGTDIRDSMDIFKYFANKKINFTSEGLLEPYSQYCGFSWVAQINTVKPWGDFENSESVPLTPLLFQGMTYYAFSTHPSLSLLYGGKSCSEGTSLAPYKDFTEGYFSNILFWGKIANKTVKNMVKNGDEWTVEYNGGGKLTTNPVTKKYKLEIDGEVYDENHYPTNSRGYSLKKTGDNIEVVREKNR